MKRTVLSIAFILASAFIAVGKESPTIVNIVNFIRQTEPRTYTGITDEELYQTVVEQIDLQKKYNFKATYLLQYDALINPLYQELLKNGVPEGTEIGGWFEITQPHVEAAGIEWRGRFSWDWAAEVDFSFGYTPQERERLVDVYMEKFKSIFGYYPKSVGSWFIDAYTLNYMYEKYGIVASCNCKDQYGTDGYTLWGGYWNQAYYPSRVNAYMPAQDADKQIPVPVFRMLGSDPIYQYDTGLEDHDQGCVITLEPVWGGERGGGLNRQWVNWFMNMMADGDCLAFNYLQAGQENSFSWAKMHEGLEMQFPLIKELADAGKFRVETLSESGEWFKNNFMQDESYDELNKNLENVEISPSLLFMPYITGSNAPENNMNAKGMFFGITAAQNRHDFALAVMEGVAHLLKKNIDAICASTGKPKMIISSGGGAKSAIWCQLKADVTGCEIGIPENEEACCLGAAIMGAVSSGAFASYEEAIANCVKIKKIYKPRYNELLEKKHQKFLELYDSVEHLF